MTNHPAPRALSRAHQVTLMAIMIAAIIVLQRFLSIRTPIIQINFMFLPIMLTGMLMGWKSATFVATIADLIGALLFPSGSFFFGYTLTAALTGFAAGICLYRPNGIKLDRNFMLRLVICILIITGALNGGLNTIWILLTTSNASNIIIPVRIAKQLIMAPVMFITMTAVVKLFSERLRRLTQPALAEVVTDND